METNESGQNDKQTHNEKGAKQSAEKSVIPNEPLIKGGDANVYPEEEDGKKGSSGPEEKDITA